MNPLLGSAVVVLQLAFSRKGCDLEPERVNNAFAAGIVFVGSGAVVGIAHAELATSQVNRIAITLCDYRAAAIGRRTVIGGGDINGELAGKGQVGAVAYRKAE